MPAATPESTSRPSARHAAAGWKTKNWKAAGNPGKSERIAFR